MRSATLALRSARSVNSASSGLSSTSRTSMSSAMTSGDSPCGRRGQREMEDGAALLAALGPDASTVARDDAPGEREAHADAGKFVRAMQPVEHAEELLDIGHVEPHAVVPHVVHDFAVTRVAADRDER